MPLFGIGSCFPKGIRDKILYVRFEDMRMQRKITLFCGVYLLGWLPIVLAIRGITGTSDHGIIFMVGWFIFFALLQFRLLKCPHCYVLAFKTKKGMYVPWAEDKCRFCNKEF